MTKLIDLTRPIEVVNKEKLPSQLLPLYRIISPEIEYINHSQGSAIMQAIFSCKTSDLPNGEGWAEEHLSMSSHLGTHVDAPWHYGSTCGKTKASTIDQIPLENLFCDAAVLDLSFKKGSGESITIKDLENALDKIEYKIKEGDAILIRTDHDKYDLCDPIKYNYPGLIRESALWLSQQGVKVGATDALGWDRPFQVMIKDFNSRKDPALIWDAHFAHRESEFYVVQQLCNLDSLPSKGFKVGFFPLKIVGASAAPARVVAFV